MESFKIQHHITPYKNTRLEFVRTQDQTGVYKNEQVENIFYPNAV